MRRLLNPLKREQGATLVEYGILVAVLALGLIPVMNLTTDAIAGSHESAASHFATTPRSYQNDGGGSATTVPPTTTTTVPPTTTTTVPPTTTTTTIPPNQVAAAQFGDEILVPFSETDGVVTYGDVEADGWTYVVTSDTGTSIRMVFTTKDPDHKVVVKGWLNSKGILKTRVIEKY